MQESDAALKDGELNVQSFLNARGFELNALDESMRRTRVSNSTRAFQRVPITLRRRAAAHNYKRVPKRLQKRARREMIQDNTPVVNSKTRKSTSTRSRLRAETAKKLGLLAQKKKRRKLEKAGIDKDTISVRAARPKIRRNVLNEPPITATKFRKRQLEKTWLPTHLWHTKRARMTDPKEPLWRFAIPLTPTAKCYRPTHRMQWEKGAIAWDMSYMSTIGLSGSLHSIRNILKALGLANENLWNDKASRWRNGAMHWTCTLSRGKQAASHIIGPAMIVWNPENKADGPEPPKTFRQLFIRVHPSAFLETFDELTRLVKKQTPRAYVEDLRHEIGSIEITGPDSTESLLGILKPYVTKSHAKEPHASRFEQLTGCRDAASLPPGALLAFSVMDPRLRYPPVKGSPTKADLEVLGNFHEIPTIPFNLFDRDARFKASRLPSQKALNRRKGKEAPGARLEPSTADPPIPVILLASRHPTNPQAPGTWTLMLPWKCVLPVWYNLMYYPLSSGGNPRFGGLDEIRQLAFERGLPWFPGDFPGTDAGKSWELSQRLVRQNKWERRPRGKRTNYETLDLGAGRKGEVGVGWNCDWEYLLGLKDANERRESQVGDCDAMEVDQDPANSGAQVREKKRTGKAPENPLENVTYLPRSAFKSHLSPKSQPPPPASLIMVHIKLLGRGTPTTCARIYRLPPGDVSSTYNKPALLVSRQAEVLATPHAAGSGNTDGNTTIGKGLLPHDLRAQWLAQKPGAAKNTARHNRRQGPMDLETRKLMLARELVSAPSWEQGSLDGSGPRHPLCPGPEHLIGFVTAGTFSLRDGCGTAVGALAASVAAEELRRACQPVGEGKRAEVDEADARLCVVRNSGEVIGRLARWEVV